MRTLLAVSSLSALLAPTRGGAAEAHIAIPGQVVHAAASVDADRTAALFARVRRALIPTAELAGAPPGGNEGPGLRVVGSCTQWIRGANQQPGRLKPLYPGVPISADAGKHDAVAATSSACVLFCPIGSPMPGMMLKL